MFRCTRCRRTKPNDQLRVVEKPWGWGTKKLDVCATCESKQAPCELCANLNHRVEDDDPDRIAGTTACRKCGLIYLEEQSA